ncbi:type II secretion system protein GspD [Mariniblastus fucicola]|uniref:type II secretion system protein GspD n=1 Tax=Mariniblastus fucicola TaxID=980251 RepID=UPI0012FAA6DE|nr:hypothetical protein [Mariniblastus fucicola]
MRVSKQLKRGLLTSAVALAFSTMPMLTSASQGQDSGFQTNGATQSASMGSAVTSGQEHLLAARRALAIGDVKGATESALQARASQADFSGLGDSPQQIDAMIARQNKLVELYQSGSAESGYDTEAAKFLMEQAEALVKYRDFKTARVLAEQSKKFTAVDFSTFSMTPDRMIQIIDIASQSAATSQVDAKTEVSRLMAQAKLFVDQNNWVKAKEVVQQAKSFNLGDDQFAKGETLPWQLDMLIDNALNVQAAGINGANTIAPASFNEPADNTVARAEYDPATDATKVVPASMENDSNTPADDGFKPVIPPVPGAKVVVAKLQDDLQNRGQQMYRSGVEAMQSNDTDRAREFFQLAMQYPADLDVNTKDEIRSQLSQMKTVSAVIDSKPEVAQTSGVDEEFGYGLKNKSEFTRLQSEVFRERQAAERMLQDNPREALQRLSMLRTKVASAQVAAETSRPLLKIVDRDITKFQDYIERNLSQIQNQEEVETRRDNVERMRQRRLDVDQQLSQLVNEYNKLIDEQRFAEARLVVDQAEELAPNTEVVSVLREKWRTVFNDSRFQMDRDDQQQRYIDAQHDVYRSADAMTTSNVLELDPDIEGYAERIRDRANRQASLRYSSEANRMIWNKLKNTDVEGEYRGTLAEAMDQLSRQAGLNIVFDTMALEAVNVSTEQMVNAPIRNPISLESALNVILSGVGLEFAVEDEVIKVTSREAQEATLITETYYIGDLLAPLKNYRNPNELSFMQAGANNGYGGFGGGSMNVPNAGPSTLAGAAAQAAMGQQLGAGGFPGAGQLGGGGYGGYGNNDPQRGTPYFGTVGNQPQGGITEADFQTLIQLIQQTVSSDSWEQNGGGNGTIQSFPPNLSLIVANSQKVQDEIRDLLKKLRELNDVQIVIEVRFVAIQDNFFERVGIDFDFSINDNSGVSDPTVDNLPRSIVVGNTGSSVGGTSNGVFLPTGNQDIQFTQGSFELTEPAFGGFDVASAANFGFAILSDIEVFFLMQAAKGSTRATVTEAPTVVMFNGQSASVNDTQQRPFVTSVQPVVGDFAVAHQPIITILPDGTNLNVTATVSSDRRSVNMALVPFFSEVTEVQTFTFTGTTRTEVSTNSLLDDLLDNLDPTNADDSDDEIQTVSEGVTIQLPVLATTSVNTVVSVPDGGTILMGGIKRMRETRTERGVPMLSSIPYVNRLFTNVGTGRETTNLMMMVTPRIIIQAEEERKQIGVFGEEE